MECAALRMHLINDSSCVSACLMGLSMEFASASTMIK